MTARKSARTHSTVRRITTIYVLAYRSLLYKLDKIHNRDWMRRIYRNEVHNHK